MRSHLVFVEASLAIADVIDKIREESECFITIVTSNPLRISSFSGLRRADNIIEVENTVDFDCVLDIMQSLNKKMPISGIVAVMSSQVEAVSYAAAVLGLPGLSLDAARVCLNKFAMRKRLTQDNFLQPRFGVISSPADVRRCIDLVGRHSVAKPVNGSNSNYISVNSSEEEIARSFQALQASERLPFQMRYEELLLEEYIEGPLVSVETFTLNGKHTVLGIADRIVSTEAFVELGGTFGQSLAQGEEVAKVAIDALNSVGFNWGPAQIEMILSRQGPVIVEINPRLAGVPVPYAIDGATGGNIMLEIARHAMGMKPQFPTIKRYSAIRCFESAKAGVVREIVPSSIAEDPRVQKYLITTQVGKMVWPLRSNSDRLGFVVATGRSREEAADLAGRIAEGTMFVLAG